MKFAERIKRILKDFQVASLILSYDQAITSLQRENIDHSISMLMAKDETERKAVRADFIERINKKNGFPTKSFAERATAQSQTKQNDLGIGK